MAPKVLITSALPYANGPLHFGHIAGAYLPADCYARFQRLKGADVLYLCGSDEYGIAISISAEKERRSPQEHVDIFHAINKAFFQKLSISFDYFARTTWPGHIETTQQFFLDLKASGYIEEKMSDQLFSKEEGRFLADRYVVGTCPKCGFQSARGDECQKCGASYEAIDLKEPRSKVTGSPLVLKATKHWFLRFDLFKDKLEAWIEDKKWKPNVLNFAKSYIEQLKERAITRDSNWGIKLPLKDTEGKVFYVWFDAPIGYISAAKEWALHTGDPDKWKSYWCDKETKLVQFVGKDNIPFHAVFFPAMVMGQNSPYKLVDELPANEFLNLEGRQFSKSEGWTIDLERFFLYFTADQIRFYLSANAPETQDSEFTWKEFQLSCNAQLLGKYGNFINRVLIFALKHTQGKVPPVHAKDGLDEAFLEKIELLSLAAKEAYETFHLRKAAHLVMELATAGNIYFDAKKPWALVKNPLEHKAVETTIALCLACMKVLALISSPLIPEAAQKVWELLGYTTELEKQNWDNVMDEKLKTGTSLKEAEPLFKKVEEEVIMKEVDLLQKQMHREASEKSPYAPLKAEIGIEEFAKVDLRIGEILSVEKVAKSAKLLKLSVDLGFEKRTIVSGISQYFEDPQTLVGKKAIIVANLKPAKLMGVESQGMLIVVHAEEKIIELPIFSLAKAGDVLL